MEWMKKMPADVCRYRYGRLVGRTLEHTNTKILVNVKLLVGYTKYKNKHKHKHKYRHKKGFPYEWLMDRQTNNVGGYNNTKAW